MGASQQSTRSRLVDSARARFDPELQGNVRARQTDNTVNWLEECTGRTLNTLLRWDSTANTLYKNEGMVVTFIADRTQKDTIDSKSPQKFMLHRQRDQCLSNSSGDLRQLIVAELVVRYQ